MSGFKQYFFLCSLIVFSVEVRAVSGSITDPALSASESSDFSSQSLHGSLKTRLTRNIRISSDKFISANRRDGLFDTLYTTDDLSLNYPLSLALPFLEDFSFIEDMSMFFVLSYRRPVYATAQEIKAVCWSFYICFNDINLGVSKPVFQTDRFMVESSVYLAIPFSKNSFDQSFIMGLGASLSTSYRLFSYSHFDLSSVSTHSMDLDFYVYEMVNVRGTHYNVPFTAFNQLGLRIYHSQYAFIPMLFFYGSHSFALNFNGTPFHTVSLNMSAAWSLNKRIRIVAGLNWGDRILKPKDSAVAADTKIFNPDRTFLSLGGSYSF